MDLNAYKTIAPRFDELKVLIFGPFDFPDNIDREQVVERCKRVVDQMPAVLAFFEGQGVDLQLGGDAGGFLAECETVCSHTDNASEDYMYGNPYATSIRMRYAIAEAELGIARKLLGVVQ